MQNGIDSLDQDLSGLKPKAWRAKLAELTEAHGLYQDLGARHFATFVDHGNTLLVTFETVQGIQNLSEQALPLGFDLVRNQGWSHLCLVSNGDTWFRDENVYTFFDQLDDDGFFEEFDNVLFYGAGPCGYAASAFSVSAPGATVLAIQPQATLDPRITEWDDRFTEMRRTSFTDRYGYAPEMLDGAAKAFVIYDPYEPLDAMHAALFARPNVTRLRMPFMGTAIQTRLIEMEILYALMADLGAGTLNESAFYKHTRARRNNGGYLKRLMAQLDHQDRPYLVALLCRNVTSRLRAPRFRRRLQGLQKRSKSGEFPWPPEAKKADDSAQ